MIADEIYHGIVDGPPAARVLDHHPDAFVVNSFSKYWSMTGWRVGWVVVPDSLVDTVERLQQNLYICAPHVSQVAALAALDATDELDGHVARYRRTGRSSSTVSPSAGITDIAPADGAFYVYAHVPHLTTGLGIDSLASDGALVARARRGSHIGRRLRPRTRPRVRPFLLRRRQRRHGRGVRPAGRVGAVSATPPLSGLRVVDMSTVLAGPNCARYLADFGADVIKVERPGGDSLRNMAWRDPRDGEGLWWKLVNRNKRTVVLDVKNAEDLDVLLALVDDANVLVENSRPGTMERLGLGPEVLLARNPALVITRVSGFGQDGPYASRPGFATIAEAMSGLAALSGEPDGQPLLPPIALTDEVTGLAAAFATMVALYSGVGQVVDANLLETMFQMMGPLASVFAVRGEQQPRLGAGLPYTVPRGTYLCSDDRWVAVSTSSDSVAARVMEVLGVGDDERFVTFAGRTEHRDELEQIMTDWCLARTRAEVIDAFTAAEAAIGPVYDMADIAADPHYAARGAIADVDGTPMQGLIAGLSATPGQLRWSGRSLDADGDDIRGAGWG